MKIEKSLFFVVAIGLFIYMSRVLPHSANFSPVIALALLSGFVGKGRWYGFVIPVSALFLSDLHIGLYPGWAFTYIPLVLAVVLGHFMTTKATSLLMYGLLGAITFFIVSNFGVWLYSGMYTPDFAGLLKCYEMGIPFFRLTLFSTLTVMSGYYAFSLANLKKVGKKALSRI